MKILVTGATGFLGGALIRTLASKHDVIALGRNAARCDHLRSDNFHVLQVDLSQPGTLPDAGQIGPVDAIIHCAALSAPWGRAQAFEDANLHGTLTALELAERLEVSRFVHISSPTVTFELKDQIRVREDHPLPHPINDYARTKALAEKEVLARPELGPVILRPRGIYGSGDEALLPRLLRAATKGPLPLIRGGAAAIDLTHISDVIRAIEAALTGDHIIEGEVFHISGGEVIPIKDIVERCCQRCDVPLRWRPLPFTPALIATRLMEWASYRWPIRQEPSITAYTLGLFSFRQSLDISKAERLLGWRPQVPFDVGFNEATQGWPQ